VLRIDGCPILAEDFQTAPRVAAFVGQRLAELVGTPAPVDATGPLEVDPETFGAVELRLRGHRGPIHVRRLDGFGPDELNALRYQLSLLPMDRGVHLDERALTVDALLDAVVATLGPAGRTLRMHAPDTVSEDEVRRIRDAMERPGALFYVDGQPEPCDEGLLFDMYEELLFDDEMWGDEDE
jgi:hypothetical protein